MQVIALLMFVFFFYDIFMVFITPLLTGVRGVCVVRVCVIIAILVLYCVSVDYSRTKQVSWRSWPLEGRAMQLETQLVKQ